MHSMCRQIDGCDSNVSEFIQGTKGSWNSVDFAIRDLQGNIVWQYDAKSEEGRQNDPYTLEHVNWISCIRNNTPIMQAEETAVSNMMAIMGRESAYTGKSVTWDEMTASPLNYTPAKMELGPMDMKLYTVAVPGTGPEK